MKVLLVGVRGHGGEEIYSRILRDHPPPTVEVSASLGFHESCAGGTSLTLQEIILNRTVYPFLAFDLGFRVLKVGVDIDVVHVHSHPTILKELRNRAVVFSAGSSHYQYLREYEGWLPERINRCYRRARWLYPKIGVIDGLLTPERSTLIYTFSDYARKAYLANGVPADKVHVLYPGFPVPSCEPNEHDVVTFLFMGRQALRKGGDLVLEAFQELRGELPDIRLIYASDQPSQREQDGVEFLPPVPPTDIGKLYGRADVFVNPTRAEGFGFTNAEAQGHGLPVISTRLGAIPEVVRDGETGILVPSGDLRQLKHAMRRLATDADLRRALGAAARAHFEKRFALPVFQRGLWALYEEAHHLAGAAS